MLDSKLPLSYESGSQRRFAPTTGNFGPKRLVTFTEIRTMRQIADLFGLEYPAASVACRHVREKAFGDTPVRQRAGKWQGDAD